MLGKLQLVLWGALFLVSCGFFKSMGESVYVAVPLALIGATLTSVMGACLKLLCGEEWEW